MKVDLGFGLKMVKACDSGARLKMVKVPRLPDPYLPPVIEIDDTPGLLQTCNGAAKPVTKRLILVDPRDGRTSGGRHVPGRWLCA